MIPDIQDALQTINNQIAELGTAELTARHRHRALETLTKYVAQHASEPMPHGGMTFEECMEIREHLLKVGMPQRAIEVHRIASFAHDGSIPHKVVINGPLDLELHITQAFLSAY